MNLIYSYVRKLNFGSSLCGFEYRMDICTLNRDFENYARLQMNEDLWNTPQGRDSSVGIATGYGLGVRGSNPSRGKILPITVAVRSKGAHTRTSLARRAWLGNRARIYFTTHAWADSELWSYISVSRMSSSKQVAAAVIILDEYGVFGRRKNRKGGKCRLSTHPAVPCSNYLRRLSRQNVGASTFHNPMGSTACYRDSFTFYLLHLLLLISLCWKR
jgi:hypothetical protein